MKIETGTPEQHPTPLPLDGSQSPATAQPAQTGRGGEQGGVADATGQRLSQLSSSEADIAAAQTAGMSAEYGRRDGYAADILPEGAEYGDLPDLPDPPAYTVVPPGSSLYPGPGDEPVAQP